MGKRIECTVDHAIALDGDYGTVMGVRVTCPRCDHSTEAFGTSARSVRRCLARMREECPLDEENYYVTDDGSEED